MNGHYEHETLAAFAAGDLDAPQDVQVGAHVNGCVGCRSVVEAVRSTMADLSGLGEEDLSEFERAALRRALAIRRARPGRISRALVAASSAAALVAAIAIGGSIAGRDAGGPSAESGAAMALSDGLPVTVDARDFDRTTVASLFPAGKTASAPAPGTMGGDSSREGLTDSGGGGTSNMAQTCFELIRSTARVPMTLNVAYAARFEGKPAFIFIFDVDGGGRELWVVDRDDCQNTYYFEQQRPQ